MSVALIEAQGYPPTSLASSLNVRMFTICPFANFLLTIVSSLVPLDPVVGFVYGAGCLNQVGLDE